MPFVSLGLRTGKGKCWEVASNHCGHKRRLERQMRRERVAHTLPSVTLGDCPVHPATGAVGRLWGGRRQWSPWQRRVTAQDEALPKGHGGPAGCTSPFPVHAVSVRDAGLVLHGGARLRLEIDPPHQPCSPRCSPSIPPAITIRHLSTGPVAAKASASDLPLSSLLLKAEMTSTRNSPKHTTICGTVQEILDNRAGVSNCHRRGQA